MAKIKTINVFDYDSSVDGPMKHIKMDSIDSITTPNHRWPIIKTGKKVKLGTERRFTTSSSFTSTDRILLSAPASLSRTKNKYTAEFAELVGWYVTEGTINNYLGRGRHTITIGQSNKVNANKVDRIRKLLTTIYGPTEPYNSSAIRKPMWVEFLGSNKEMTLFRLNAEASESIFKVVPNFSKDIKLDFIHSLSRSQLQRFVEAAMEGDGHYYGVNMHYSGAGIHPGIFWQKSEIIFNAVELALILLGVPVTRYYSKKLGHGLRIKVRNTVAPKMRPKNIKDVAYTGKVWCPTTDNGTWLARSNNTIYYTGNSNAVAIDEALFKSHIEPMLLLIVDALTIVYFRPALRATNLYSELEIQRMVVWYDASSVTTRNDRAADADSGFEKMLFPSKRGKAHGFSIDDAPTDKETVLRMLLSKGSLTPELTEALLTVIAPDFLAEAKTAGQQQSVAPITPAIQSVLDGAPTPTPETADVAPGQDAPPFPLAEPEETPTPVANPDEV